MTVFLTHLLVGSVAAIGPKGVPSAIDKRPVEHALKVKRDGFEADAQGDRKRHGGAEKAVHHYPYDHYAAWRHETAAPILGQSGAFGENLSTTGMDESTVAIGDVFRVGGALLEVSQGRQPCWKLNIRFDVADMAKRVQVTGRTGWYYRVLEEGIVSPGDELSLFDRRAPEWTVRRLWHAMYVDALNLDDLAAIAALEPLADTMRRAAAKRLEAGVVEDWSRRLTGNVLGD